MASRKHRRTKTQPKPAPLVEQYRAIGPASLLAALIFAQRARMRNASKKAA